MWDADVMRSRMTATPYPRSPKYTAGDSAAAQPAIQPPSAPGRQAPRRRWTTLSCNGGRGIWSLAAVPYPFAITQDLARDGSSSHCRRATCTWDGYLSGRAHRVIGACGCSREQSGIAHRGKACHETAYGFSSCSVAGCVRSSFHAPGRCFGRSNKSRSRPTDGACRQRHGGTAATHQPYSPNAVHEGQRLVR
jgi:hypothetical protein